MGLKEVPYIPESNLTKAEEFLSAKEKAAANSLKGFVKQLFTDSKPVHPDSANDIAGSGNEVANQIKNIKQYNALLAVNNAPKDNTSTQVISPDLLSPNTQHLIAAVTKDNPNIINQVNNLKPEKIKMLESILEKQSGAAGVREGATYGDCWFEASVASLASIVKGQQELAKMITKNSDGSYNVTFPGEPLNPIKVTNQDIINDKLYDPCKWASIIEAAMIKEYPNEAKNGGYSAVALQLLTGNKAKNIILPQSQENNAKNLEAKTNIEKLIHNGLKNGDGIVAAAKGNSKSALNKGLIVQDHDYTVIGFDPTTHEVILRNPWGVNHAGDEKLPPMGQTVNGVKNLGGGEISMNFDTFLNNYSYVTIDKLGNEDINNSGTLSALYHNWDIALPNI